MRLAVPGLRLDVPPGWEAGDTETSVGGEGGEPGIVQPAAAGYARTPAPLWSPELGE